MAGVSALVFGVAPPGVGEPQLTAATSAIVHTMKAGEAFIGSIPLPGNRPQADSDWSASGVRLEHTELEDTAATIAYDERAGDCQSNLANLIRRVVAGACADHAAETGAHSKDNAQILYVPTGASGATGQEEIKHSYSGGSR